MWWLEGGVVVGRWCGGWKVVWWLEGSVVVECG